MKTEERPPLTLEPPQPAPARPPSLPPPPPPSGLPRSLLRLIMLGGLVLASLIPLALIDGVLDERRGRRDEAVSGISTTWGEEQELFGPVLVLPYRRAVRVTRDEVVDGVVRRREVTETQVARASFLPASLQVTGRLSPTRRYRGIYEAVVYEADLEIAAEFQPPDFSAWKIAEDDVLWGDAELVLGVTDLRGTRRLVSFDWGGRSLATTPGTDLPVTESGLRARLAQPAAPPAAAPGGPWHFAASLSVNGSRSLMIAPVGMSNRVELASTWPDPSFHGGFLPASRGVGPDGFNAVWDVSYYGRKFPQQWTDADGGAAWTRDDPCRQSFFGVSLLSLVDSYRVVERAIKYGLLIVVLTFALFFLMERLTGVRVHPLQYGLTAAALCLFYLAFLSLSEFLPVGLAYTAGAALCTLMIALYTRPALGSARRSGLLAAGLAGLYAFLYLVLQAQDYSLLIGTAGLFAALALVMVATRHIEG